MAQVDQNARVERDAKKEGPPLLAAVVVSMLIASVLAWIGLPWWGVGLMGAAAFVGVMSRR